MNLEFSPLTLKKWNDFKQLLGTHGAYSGCWCMFWRLTRQDFSEGCKGKIKQDMKDLLFSDTIPGVLAYADGQPVGRCSIAPLKEFGSLERSRTLKGMCDKPVW